MDTDFFHPTRIEAASPAASHHPNPSVDVQGSNVGGEWGGICLTLNNPNYTSLRDEAYVWLTNDQAAELFAAVRAKLDTPRPVEPKVGMRVQFRHRPATTYTIIGPSSVSRAWVVETDSGHPAKIEESAFKAGKVVVV